MELHIPMSQSLKDKRQVSRSLNARIRNKFNVAVAEESDDDRWQGLTLVICCASNDISHAHQILSKVQFRYRGPNADNIRQNIAWVKDIARGAALATQTKGDDPFGYRAEAIQLMRLAASLSEN